MLIQMVLGVLVFTQVILEEVKGKESFLLSPGECIEAEGREKLQYSSKVCCREGDMLDGVKENEFLFYLYDKLHFGIRPYASLLLRCVTWEDQKTMSKRGPFGVLSYGEMRKQFDCKGSTLYSTGASMMCVSKYKYDYRLDGDGVALHSGRIEQDRTLDYLVEYSYNKSGNSVNRNGWYINGQPALKNVNFQYGVDIEKGDYYSLDGKRMNKLEFIKYHGYDRIVWTLGD